MQQFVLLALAASAQAFPALRDMANAQPEFLQAAAGLASRTLEKRQKDALGQSRSETNCGPTPCLEFNEADQFVSTTGQNAYQSPAASDIRGPCPGLNAATNHGIVMRCAPAVSTSDRS